MSSKVRRMFHHADRFIKSLLCLVFFRRKEIPFRCAFVIIAEMIYAHTAAGCCLAVFSAHEPVALLVLSISIIIHKPVYSRHSSPLERFKLNLGSHLALRLLAELLHERYVLISCFRAIMKTSRLLYRISQDVILFLDHIVCEDLPVYDFCVIFNYWIVAHISSL